VSSSERAELRALMKGLVDGDRSAFRPAFALLWPKLRAFALRYAGAADGEDAAQRALMRVFARAGEYDPARDPLAWALGIAAWECRTARRKRARQKEDVAALVQQPDEVPTPEAAMIDAELRAAVAVVLGTLRPIDVETISALAKGERLSGSTFRKRLQRALLRFRSAWRATHGHE
jgi:RNA polymerase sigma-70 factor (ECF subfamily)